MNRTYQICLVALFLVGCSSNRLIFKSDRFDDFETLKLTRAIELEKKLRAKDITPDHFIGLGNGIYPNKNSYQLATPKTFQRIDGNFELEVQYFYTESDQSVKVILYQWDSLEKPIFETSEQLEEKYDAFQKKWNDLVKILETKLGSPSSENMESYKFSKSRTKDEGDIENMINFNGQDTSWRDDVKWLSKDGINAYLFMFGNNQTGYRQISLAIYKN